MSKDDGIRLRLDRRNVEICKRNGQPLGQRVNTIIDRYAHLVDSQRATLLNRFDELEIAELVLALRPVVAQRSSAAELKALWLLGLAHGSDARAHLTQLAPVDVIVLAEALEGRQVNLVAQA